jgi:hypothetical protein
MGNRPAPQPNWGYGVARWDICKLQPMRKVVQQLQQAGLVGAEVLWTFVSHRIQLLRWREATMWMYLGPSCLDCSFSTELENIEIDIRI